MEKQQKVQICTVSCYYQKISLIWPTKNEEFHPSKWFYIRQLIFIVTVGVPVMSLFLLHLIKSVQEGDIDVSEDLAVLAAFVGMAVVMVIFVAKQKHLAILLRDLSDFTEFGQPELFHPLNRKLHYTVHAAFMYTVIGSTIYNGFKIYNISNCRRLRKIREACGVIIPIWTPFDSDHWLTLVLLELYVFFFILTVDRAVVILSAQMYEIASHMKLRIDQLNAMFLTCFDPDTKTARQRLNDCIRYHNQLIDFGVRFDNCYTHEMFLILCTVATICGCLENQVTKHFDLGATLHMLGWMAALFVLCWCGQILMDSSISVADAAYDSKWYEADVSLRKDLILVIMRSQKPLLLRTGPFNVLRLSVFVSIMKMSYSIYTLLC